MAIIRLQFLRKSSTNGNAGDHHVPKGYCAVYVGECEKKRFVIPISYLNRREFRVLLSQAVEEYGYHHPMGGLTIPCSEDIFVDLTSRLSR